MKILIVDDNKSTHVLLQEALLLLVREIKIEILVAHDGQDGLKVLSEEKNFDILFSDINMPVMDGIEMIMEIRKRGDQFSPKKIVLMSADIEGVGSALQKFLRVDYMLKKPFGLADIGRILKDPFYVSGASCPDQTGP